MPLPLAPARLTSANDLWAPTPEETLQDHWIQGLAGRDTLTGGDGADRLEGGSWDDVLAGGIGADTLFGGTGNDTLSGEDGNDWLSGGADQDSLTGGSGNDTLHGGAGFDTLDGGEGNDYLNGGDGFDVLRGGAGKDRFVGGASSDTIDGGADSDTVLFDGHRADYRLENVGNGSVRVVDLRTGDADVDLLIDIERVKFGSAASVSLVSLVAGQPTDASETITGTDGADTIYAIGGNDTVDGADGHDAIYGGGGDDLLSGGAGDDLLVAGTGADRLRGGIGADTLVGGYGTAEFDGGDGLDTVKLAGRRQDYEFRLEPNGDLKMTYLDPFDSRVLTSAVVRGVESFEFSDRVVARGDLVIVGGNTPTMGDDTLTGTSGADRIDGLSGNDSIIGGDGDDQLIGGNGNDTLVGGSGGPTQGLQFDILDGGAGDDLMFALIGNSAALGGAGYDTVQLVSLANTTGPRAMDWQHIQNVEHVIGSSADDIVDLVGYWVSGVGVTSRGFPPMDPNAPEGVRLDGGLGNDNLRGTNFTDQINGGLGNDILAGNGGADTLVASLGQDVFIGGAGVDHFDLRTMGSGIGNLVSIEDFARGQETIDMRGLGLSSAAMSVQQTTIAGGTAVVTFGAPGNQYIIGLKGIAAGDVTTDMFLL